MPELTQEQIDAIVAEKIAEAKKGLFTEEDLQKRVTAEVDRRVESGIQKGLETQKQKWEKEFQDRATLSAEELAKKQLEEKMSGLTAKEKEIARKHNTLTAKEMLADAQIPKAQYEKLITMLVTDDEEATKARVQDFVDMFNSTKTEIETKVKTEFSKIPPPAQGSGEKTVTKEDFNKMGYAEKIKFKAENPELYKQFIGQQNKSKM